MHHISRGGCKPLMAAPVLCSGYSRWFYNGQMFSGVPGVPVGSHTAPRLPRRSWSSVDVTGHSWMKLEVFGCPWACLCSSRMFGHRHVLAGQSYGHWVGVAHSRSRIEVEGLREQLCGQGRLCIDVCVIYWLGEVTYRYLVTVRLSVYV